MVDNRSAGFFGIGGAFNFKGGNISGTAANLSDDKMGQGGEYANLRKEETEEKTHGYPFMDRSAVLRATLNSLAMMNVADVINAKQRRVEAISDEQPRQQRRDEEPEAQAEEENSDADFAKDFDFAGELD